MTWPDLRSRVRGMFLAGAAGDALGAPIEFLRLSDIERQYGEGGPETYVAGAWPAGSITDDTQMTLFTAEGIIRAVASESEDLRAEAPRIVHHAYLRWLHTQGEPVPMFDHSRRAPDGWLVKQAFLYGRRAPGNTCLGALRASAARLGAGATNGSKGCGGVMRMAPAAAWDLRGGPLDSFEQGRAYGALTHGHPTGSLAAGVMARMTAFVLAGRPLTDAARAAAEPLWAEPQSEETLAAIEAALALAGAGDGDAGRVESLGAGWVAEEALAIGLYAALVAPDVRTGLRLAVNHGGDSDSTGAIAGNLLGALHGEAAIPDDLIQGLEGREVIGQLADDLLYRVIEPRDTTASGNGERYPGW